MPDKRVVRGRYPIRTGGRSKPFSINVVIDPNPPMPVPKSNKSSSVASQSRSRSPHAAVDSESKPQQPRNDRFYRIWDRFTRKPPPPKTTQVEALDHDTEGRPSHPEASNSEGAVVKENVATTFEVAAASCRAKVKAIVKECHRLNKKYYDPLFDLHFTDALSSLEGYVEENYPNSMRVKGGVAAVKRVTDIFENPKFIVDGATAGDVRQGRVGDCWFLAALMALSGREELITRLCVAKDEKCGVYGFCFYRDGEWISEVVDDYLCILRDEDQRQIMVSIYSDKEPIENDWKDMYWEELPKDFKEGLRKGPDALFFSSIKNGEETWLPLCEKAFAKAHLSYQAIEGGSPGEGIEDLTGGVSSSLQSEDILDLDLFWKELTQVNQNFLFGCGSRRPVNEDRADEEGFVRGHAYTVLAAKEVQGHRLLKIKNPWQKQEWNGAWSDGSKEWTPEMMKALDHRFGDDGIFWISFKDFLHYYPTIDRTRLFGEEWTVVQQWKAIKASRNTSFFNSEYVPTKFGLTITKAGPTVIVLSKPDNRYFKGLEGRYRYSLHFRLYKEGEKDYLVRSMHKTMSGRSCSAELELSPGNYSIHIKIVTTRDDECKTPEEVIKKACKGAKQMLLATGQMYDMAHSKGRLRETENAVAEQNKVDAIARKHKVDRSARNHNREARRRHKARAKRVAEEIKRKKAEKATAKAKSPEASVAGEAASLEEKVSGVLPLRTAGDTSVEKPDTESGAMAKKDQVEERDPEEMNKPASSEKDGEAESDDDSEESEVSSVEDDDFSFDSDIDASVVEDDSDDKEDSETDDVFGDDPWNAICVVGLRVYSKDADAQIQIDDGQV